MNIYWIFAIAAFALVLFLYLKKRRILLLHPDQVDMVRDLLGKELLDVRDKRDKLINKHASEGKTIPIDGFIDTLDTLLAENPDNEEMAIEVEGRRKELLTKYKDGVPIEIAYQWMKEDEHI